MGSHHGVSSLSPLCARCHQMDDFSPAKNLMTMCFTYYYIGKGTCSPGEALKCVLCWERCWRGGPGGKELRIRAELLVLLLCPCFQPGIFVCDTPRCSQPLGMGFEQPSPETPWVYCLVAGPSRGLDFLSKMGPGRIKIKIKTCRNWGGILGVSISWSPGAGSTQWCHH